MTGMLTTSNKSSGWPDGQPLLLFIKGRAAAAQPIALLYRSPICQPTSPHLPCAAR
ncbi:MAG: hypothetical protein V9H69_03770 [Anaerolineae bacterium]